MKRLTTVAAMALMSLFVARGNDRAVTDGAGLTANPVSFEELPLGSVKPSGWLRDALVAQRDGISAGLDQTYPQVMGPRNGWLGGDGDQWERGPYWIDGLLPLSYVLDDDALKEKVKPWVEWALSSQLPSGNFGPQTDYPREAGIQRNNALDWWPRIVVLKILWQHYNATSDPRVIPFFHNYFRYQLSELKSNPLGRWTFWAKYRQADEMLIVLWLYRQSGERYLLELADLLHQQGFDFVDYFRNEGISRMGSIHCVNLAQGLKEPVVYWQCRHDPELLKAEEKFFNDLPRFISYPTGMFGGDESLRDNDPTRGSELCSAIELMYSLEEMLKITGNPFYADYLERICFNALPAQLSRDFREHQYYQQVNQIGLTLGSHNFAQQQGGTGQVLGFLTGYPCCLSNLHQGLPKFTQNLWLRSDDGGLAAFAYSPCRVEAEVGGKLVAIDEETRYPADGTIVLKLSLNGVAAFPLRLRIPSWADGPSVNVNGKAVKDGVAAGEVVVLKRKWKDGDRVELVFPRKISISRWHSNSASVECGPLVYALPLEGKTSRKIVPSGNHKGMEYTEMVATSAWNYSLMKADVLSGGEEYRLNPDLSISVRGARVPDWTESYGDAGPLPYSPSGTFGTGATAEFNVGPVEDLKLVPYGTTKLRIAEFPVLR